MGREILWSPSRIDAANYCRMKYYLKYIEHNQGIQLSAFLKGGLLHELIENFWNRLNVKYSNAEEFAAYAQGKWQQQCIRSEHSSRPVVWRYPEERWVRKKDLEGICETLFPLFMQEGKPIYSELGFTVRIGGRTFTGRIDEIRKRFIDEINRIIIRDYKSGRPFIGEMKLNFDPQPTIYNAALNGLLSVNDDIARALGFDGRVINADGSFINHDFVQEYFMLEAPNFVRRRGEEGKVVVMPHLHEAKRIDDNFYEVIRMIEGTEEDVATGNIYAERGRKCDDCDMKNVCAAKLMQSREGPFSVKGQMTFEFAVPRFAQTEMPNQKDPTQKKIIFRKPRNPKIIAPSPPLISS